MSKSKKISMVLSAILLLASTHSANSAQVSDSPVNPRLYSFYIKLQYVSITWDSPSFWGDPQFDQYVAFLYTNGDCSGDPKQTKIEEASKQNTVFTAGYQKDTINSFNVQTRTKVTENEYVYSGLSSCVPGQRLMDRLG